MSELISPTKSHEPRGQVTMVSYNKQAIISKIILNYHIYFMQVIKSLPVSPNSCFSVFEATDFLLSCLQNPNKIK